MFVCVSMFRLAPRQSGGASSRRVFERFKRAVFPPSVRLVMVNCSLFIVFESGSMSVSVTRCCEDELRSEWPVLAATNPAAFVGVSLVTLLLCNKLPDNGGVCV